MYFVYILKSTSKGKYYKGLTSNLDRRLSEHAKGEVASTRNLRPFKLVYVQMTETLKEARNLEKFFKSGYGREIIREIT